jgi:hypothetical protein
MTYVVPNYFIEKNDSRIVDLEEIYCINYITKYREDFLSIRNTMHALMIPLIGQKIITTNEKKLDINSSNICFLYQEFGCSCLLFCSFICCELLLSFSQ